MYVQFPLTLIDLLHRRSSGRYDLPSEFLLLPSISRRCFRLRRLLLRRRCYLHCCGSASRECSPASGGRDSAAGSPSYPLSHWPSHWRGRRWTRSRRCTRRTPPDRSSPRTFQRSALIYIRFDAFKKHLPRSIVIGDGLRELPGVGDGHTVCAEVVVGGQGGARIGAISTDESGERHAAHRRGGRGRGGRVAQHGKLDEQKMIQKMISKCQGM